MLYATTTIESAREGPCSSAPTVTVRAARRPRCRAITSTRHVGGRAPTPGADPWRDDTCSVLSNALPARAGALRTPGLHLQAAYHRLGRAAGDSARAESFAAASLSLPMLPGISASAQQLVADALRRAAQKVA
jgi:hypothetical protein